MRIAGHRCWISASPVVRDFVCFRIQLPRGGLQALARDLARVEDVVAVVLRSGETERFEVSGRAFVGDLLIEPRARRTATLFVELTGAPPGVPQNFEQGLWALASQVAPMSMDPIAPRLTLQADKVPVVSGLRLTPSPRGDGFLCISAAEKSDAVANVSREQVTALRETLARAAELAQRYTDSIEERRTKPSFLWHQVSPHELMAQGAVQITRIGSLVLTPQGSNVLLEIGTGASTTDLVLGLAEIEALQQALTALSVRPRF